MRRTGLTYAGKRVWTAQEIATLRSLHPNYGAFARALSGRTRNAIEKKSQRAGLPKPRRIWSNREFQLIKPLYAQGAPMRTILRLLPGKTAKQVWAKAAARGVRRPRRPPCITGFAPGCGETARVRAAHVDDRVGRGGWPRGLLPLSAAGGLERRAARAAAVGWPDCGVLAWRMRCPAGPSRASRRT